MNLEKRIKFTVHDFQKAVISSVNSRRKIFSTFLLSSLAFTAMMLASKIGYSFQMFSSGLNYWPIALKTTTVLTIQETGLVGFMVPVVYSVLIGITLTNFYTLVRTSGLRLRNLSGIAPGFVAAGCAGCGVGLLGLLGVSGALAILPFHGELIRLGGILVLLYFIVETGDPKTCSSSSL